MKVLDLFSGIGGFSLGLERAGMQTVAFCEIEPFPRAVLKKHWPEVPCYEDVRTLTADRLAADGIGKIDVICGGFPCQDVSNAGTRSGLEGARSGLWSEIVRLVRDIRPRYVLVENVSALLSRGFGRVVGDLAALGYDAEWHCIPASYLGAEHNRDRVWIIAYPMRQGLSMGSEAGANESNAADLKERFRFAFGTEVKGLERCGKSRWGGNVHGIPARMDRIKALGNAVVPQIPEMIGRAIMEQHQ